MASLFLRQIDLVSDQMLLPRDRSGDLDVYQSLNGWDRQQPLFAKLSRVKELLSC